MAGSPYGSGNGFANGIFVAYWLKLCVAVYVLAYHQFGFRLPSLPFDIAYLMQSLGVG